MTTFHFEGAFAPALSAGVVEGVAWSPTPSIRQAASMILRDLLASGAIGWSTSDVLGEEVATAEIACGPHVAVLRLSATSFFRSQAAARLQELMGTNVINIGIEDSEDEDPLSDDIVEGLADLGRQMLLPTAWQRLFNHDRDFDSVIRERLRDMQDAVEAHEPVTVRQAFKELVNEPDSPTWQFSELPRWDSLADNTQLMALYSGGYPTWFEALVLLHPASHQMVLGAVMRSHDARVRTLAVDHPTLPSNLRNKAASTAGW